MPALRNGEQNMNGANQKPKSRIRSKFGAQIFLLRDGHDNSYIRVDHDCKHDVRASGVIMQRSKLHSQYSPFHRWTGEQSTPEWSETMAARKKSSGRKKAAGRKTARKPARKTARKSTGRKTARKSAAKKRKR